MDEFEQKVAEQHENLATELLSELKVQTKRWFFAFAVTLALLFISNMAWLYAWSQFDTVVVDSQDGGNASYIGNDGDVNNYGTSYSPTAAEPETIEGNAG